MRGSPVTLIDGTVVDSWSQEWREETGARAVAVYEIVVAADWEHDLWLQASRLGGGAEQERRLRDAVMNHVRDRIIPPKAADIAAMVYRESRAEALRVFTERWGEDLGGDLRAATIKIFEARKAASAAPAA